MDKARQKKIQKLLNHKLFQIKPKSNSTLEIYDQALTHSSFARELLDKNLTSINNERLEFFGNFVLGLVVSEYLFTKFDYTEGEMTKRMVVVSDAILAEVVNNLQLNLVENGYLQLGKRSKDKQRQVEESIIAGWFEAFIGAIYLDQGLEKAREVILGVLSEEINNFDINKNYIGRLQELVQQKKLGELEYIDRKITGPDHRPTFKALVKISNRKYGEGKGLNKKAARMKAAKTALKKLRAI
jgi:ribonuclease-3